jgi:hypothetical protein
VAYVGHATGGSVEGGADLEGERWNRVDDNNDIDAARTSVDADIAVVDEHHQRCCCCCCHQCTNDRECECDDDDGNDDDGNDDEFVDNVGSVNECSCSINEIKHLISNNDNRQQ